jgi:hypothetical protein
MTPTITFYGNETDQFGMPKPYHHYEIQVRAAPWNRKNNVVAVVIPRSDEAPPLNPQYFPGATAEEAVKAAKAALKNLAGNKDLQCVES